MHDDGDGDATIAATTTTTSLAFTDALKGGKCLTFTNFSASFWNNAAAVTDDNDNNNGMNLKFTVVPLAATYLSKRYYRPSCSSLAVGGLVSGGVIGGTFGAAMAISSGAGRQMVLASSARNAVGFGLWTGTFRGTRCVFARSGIPGSDGVLGATAAGAATGAFLTVALAGFDMRRARPSIVNNAAGSALIAGIFSLLSTI